MAKILISLVLLCASLLAQVTGSGTPTAGDGGNPRASSVQSVNSVIEWNRTLLVIVRTPGAQPPTIHSTRSFAILHATVYDAVNNIDGTFSPYLVRLPDVSRHASRPAAADQAPMMCWSRSTQLFGRHSTPSFSRTWRKFRMGRIRLRVSR